ncbi:spermidine/putrescine abc transporter, ATP-binding protein pota [Heliomicrobium modesticaldum Ice1]|uniref:Spermidine/putrescine abc transporter, ATP-binding protein pota n=1 Tax=Heliobacterium modesticaldum (strain ATCC 51547 / Ice1) TaxID=498761 RepID=B0THP9_HELMI|nr:ABC transporter ATP-binding protein [Heliomicrobium modesticaldum]ABZ84832.1 spermidine/putrescine abc transporter, ATP-binding protein pota [Heliomicrobium modesticaldum Ice1]
MKVMIRLHNVEKAFDGNQVLSPISLEIHEGEFFTLLGPSGCGKTTLLRIIAGLETPTGGEVFLDGQPMAHLPPYRRDVNMIFQHYALFPHMTVEENIRFGLKMKQVPQAEQDRRIDEVIHLTQLGEFRRRKPKQLSGGQQQRVAIARAIVNNPKVLLLDEPLGALDYQLRKNLQLELKNLQKRLGLTFVYVTHDQEEAITMSDRILIMNRGKIEQLGTVHEVYHAPESLFAAKFIGENNIFRQGEVDYAVRPEKINHYDISAGESGPDPVRLRRGVIEEVVFHGTMDKVFVRLDDGALVLTYQYFDDLRKWKVGERVGIAWAPQDEVRLRR